MRGEEKVGRIEKYLCASVRFSPFLPAVSCVVSPFKKRSLACRLRLALPKVWGGREPDVRVCGLIDDWRSLRMLHESNLRRASQ